MARWFISCLFFFMTVAAQAQDRRCSDDDGNDRCTAEAIAAQDQLFRLKCIAELNAEGAWVRRAVYVDGYGNDLLAISFIRARGADPVVELRLPVREVAPLATPIDPVVWESVMEQGGHFDRRLVPIENNGSDISICLHSWVVRVEASDPGHQSPNVVGAHTVAGATRGVVENACGGGLAVDYAFVLADFAVRELPHCRLLDRQRQRNSVTLLASCMGLSGDRIAAARAANSAAQVRFLRNSNLPPERYWPRLFAENARIVSSGAVVGEGRQAADRFAQWFPEEYRIVGISFGGFNGLDADTVRSRAVISRSRGGNDNGEYAPATVRWTQRIDSAVIESMDIGEFGPLSTLGERADRHSGNGDQHTSP